MVAAPHSQDEHWSVSQTYFVPDRSGEQGNRQETLGGTHILHLADCHSQQHRCTGHRANSDSLGGISINTLSENYFHGYRYYQYRFTKIAAFL
jgi:hypothetical protein